MTAIPPTQLPNSSSYIPPQSQVITPNLQDLLSSQSLPQSLVQPSVSITNTQTPQMENLDTMLPETLPELCNEFYTEFMESNNFFGITEEKEKNELIEIIQHFCIWLFRNEYTKSKLSLAR